MKKVGSIFVSEYLMKFCTDCFITYVTDDDHCPICHKTLKEVKE